MKRYTIYESDITGTWEADEDKTGTWVRYEDVKDDRALLEEAVRLLKISYRHLPQLYGETEDELLQGQIQNFLARAKESGIG